jgi:hypothetical protein
MGTAQPTLRVRRQDVLIIRLKIGNRMLETVENRRPKFHPIQLGAQALKGFDQISHDCIGCLFPHSCVAYPGVFCVLTD